MTTTRKAAPGEPEERLDNVMTRLEQIVGALEKGELPLEDALKAFEEGVGLVKRGQSRLEDMERRIEELMTDGRTTRPMPEPAAKQGAPRNNDDDVPS